MSPHASHFESLEQQALAARFGMLLFLASEILLFSGLFTLWASYQLVWSDAFRTASLQTDRTLGLVNTVVLLTASFAAAMSVHRHRGGSERSSALGLGAAALLGVLFLVLKGLEWSDHLHHGLVPGGDLGRGTQLFWTLYYGATGLHAIHVTVGVAVLLWLAVQVWRGRIPTDHGHVVDNGVAYWHLVDAIWLFLWPMFYLIRGPG